MQAFEDYHSFSAKPKRKKLSPAPQVDPNQPHNSMFYIGISRFGLSIRIDGREKK